MDSTEGVGEAPVADMETAAVGAVADALAVPWAGLRVVSDAQRSVGDLLTFRRADSGSFEANFRAVADAPAETLPALFEALAARNSGLQGGG